MESKNKKKKGFTLIELLLSITIIAMIGAMGAPIYQAFQNRNDLHLSTMVTTQNLRRAQVLSQASDGDSAWGVHLEPGLITLFKGNSYDSRDQAYDELSNVANSIQVGGDTEIVFTKHAGELNQNKEIILTSLDNKTKNIQVNQKGMIQH